MVFRKFLALALLGACATSLPAEELVSVSGSNVKYPATIDNKVGDKQVQLVLTGTALRKKFVFSVYAIGSYIAEGVSVSDADELAAKDCAKQLHLVMERDVGGREMAEAFKSAIRNNYDAPDFDDELATLLDTMKAVEVTKGDHVWLTHIPGVGFHCELVGKTEVTIKNVAFARAVWEIYLGKNNLGEAIKKGLVSRL